MSIEGQGHFFTINFPGFVCFVLYLAKISGERLQDHWSSGFQFNLLVLYFFVFVFFVLCVLFIQTTLFYMLHCFSVMPGGLFLRWNWWVIAGLTHQ